MMIAIWCIDHKYSPSAYRTTVPIHSRRGFFTEFWYDPQALDTAHWLCDSFADFIAPVGFVLLSYMDEMALNATRKNRARKEATMKELKVYVRMFIEAKSAEIKSWFDNDVFDLVDIRQFKPKNFVTGRWVLTVKRDRDGKFQKCKARWVLRGFQDRQKDAQQTDSPTSTRPGLRLLCQNIESFLDRIVSLKRRLQIFLLSSFQLTCAALRLGTSILMSFPNESLESDDLVAAYCRDGFQHSCLQQDKLEAAYSQSPTRASQLDSLQQKELCRINLASLISQLDLVSSLSLTWFGSPRCRYQLQSDSFDRSSFEHRALPCAALLDTTRISTQLQNRQVQRFQLPLQQLCFGLVQGGVQHRASYQPAFQTRALRTALTLISLRFANAWLKTSSTKAWRRRPLRKSLCRRSLSTRSSQPALATSSTTPATSSLRRTLLPIVWFNFLFTNFFLSSSFWKTEVDKHNELSQTVWEQELEELQVDKSFPLDHRHDHLGKENLWSDQLQQNNFNEKNKKKKQQNQLSASVPDRELSQLHLHQLCLQDPASAISRQIPEESLSSICLSDSSLDPAASLSDKLRFSKQKLSEQDLSNNSLDKFFSANFGQQLSEQPLQQNLSIDQQQLQENKLTQNNQLSLAQPSFKEKILHNELATTFDKKSFAEHLSFQNFYFTNLAFQTTTSGELAEKNFYKKQLQQSNLEACKEQLPATGFAAASDNKQLSSSSLVQKSGAKATSHKELLHRELPEEQLADRTSTRTPLQRTACRQELLQTQLLPDQLSRRDLQPDSFSASSLPEESFRTATSQTAALRTGLSDRQLQGQQLDRSNLQQSSFEKNNFKKSNFTEHSFEANSFDRSTLEPTSFYWRTFEDQSFDQTSFEDSSLEETSLADNSFADSNFQEATFKEENFQEDSFTDSSFKEETFSNNSLAEETFSASSFPKSSLEESSLDKSSFPENNLEPSSLTPSSLEQNSLDKSSFTKSSFTKSSFAQHSFYKNNFDESSFTNTAASTRATSKRAASTRAAWKRAARRAALNRAAWSRTASKTRALQQAT